MDVCLVEGCSGGNEDGIVWNCGNGLADSGYCPLRTNFHMKSCRGVLLEKGGSWVVRRCGRWSNSRVLDLRNMSKKVGCPHNVHVC